MSFARKATHGDLARICRTVTVSFAEEPIVRWLFPDDEEYFAGLVMRPFLRRLLAHDETYITDDCVAVAAFVPPGRPEVEVDVEPETDLAPAPPERVERYIALGEAMHEHTPPEPHWYLNVLGTHPDWQRQGLGALLMSMLFATCDEQGSPMYLETGTPSNVAYYGHHGFIVRSEFDVGAGGPHLWGMIRHHQTEDRHS